MPLPKTLTVDTKKLVIVAILLFFEALLAGFIPIFQESKWPNEFQLITIVLVAVSAAVTYALSIYKG